LTDFFSDRALTNITEHLLPGLWPLLLAFAVCVLAVPPAIYLSRRFGWIAQPGGRHAHANPTPVLGGLAMYAGFAVAVGVFLPRYSATPGVLLVSGLAMALLAIDDRWPMRPLVKLAVQLGLALLAVVVFGIEVKFFSLPGGHLIQLGLLMAPVSAIPRVLARHGLKFNDIALWEIHEAFSAQVLCHIKALEHKDFVREKAGVEQMFGSFPRDRMNPNGGSVALGRPFAATGARILSQALKELAALPKGSRAIVSLCADGGLGTVALLEH